MDYVRDETRLGELLTDWTALSSTTLAVVSGLAVLVLLFLGTAAWSKGRKFGAVLTWLVLALSVGWFLTPVAWLSGPFDDDESVISLGLAIATGAVFVFGLIAVARLAKPSSWWAQRLYASEKYDKSVERFGWSRIRAR